MKVSKDFSSLLVAARTKDGIEKTFSEVLVEYETENKQIVKSAGQSLFTFLFKKEITNNVTVSPQYIEKRIQEATGSLWELTRN